MFPYIGGKANHIKWLDQIFPSQPDFNMNSYVEVFGGAGWVGIKSEKITVSTNRVYNDFNVFIANIHECFRNKQVELLNQLQQYPKSNKELYRQFQQEIFGTVNPTVILGDVVLAAKYLYLQTQIFSGITIGLNTPSYFCDTASNGKYASKYDAVINKLNNPKYISRLSQVSVVENMDCIDLIKKYDSDTTFFYVDPPYFKKEYLYTHEFPREKHEQLSDTLKNTKGRWCLSYYDFDELKQWYPEDQYYWHRQDVFRWSSTRGHKQTDYKKNSRGVEIAIMNYDPNATVTEPSTTIETVSESTYQSLFAEN